MQSTKSTWLGLATLGVLAIGCTPGATDDDEVGEGTDGNTDDTSSSEDESSDSGDTSASTTQDTSEATDDTSEATDDTDEATDDETGETDDFQLIEAAFADDFATLVLTFNDAVAPVDTVDPSDFRISMAATVSYDYMGMAYDMSYYIDPNTYVDQYAMPVGMMAIANGPGADQISLTLEPVFDMDACAALEDLLAMTDPAYMPEGHFFPHYAPGDIPLTSEGGSELAAIGPEWVLTDMTASYVESYQWPNLNPQVPIPCR